MPPADTPRISVIVPVHNVRDHVAACIASLRAQTWRDFEALVVDDGSTDDSAAVARAAIAGDPRFRLISQHNRGLSGARNTGLDAARGGFVAFVDSDDRLSPDYLMQLHAALEDTGADWVACAVRSCFADGTSDVHSAIHGAAALSSHPAMSRHRLDTWSAVIRHFPSAWNKLYRRSLIEGLRFDEGTWFEDHGFFLDAAARTDHLLHLPEPLYLQTRDRPGQITASDDDRVFEQFDVLRSMRARMAAGGKTGADTGFSRIASRLVFERSTALRDPDRRARFAAAAGDFLAAEGLVFDPGWDRDISRLWGHEMAGHLPLSVVLPWDGTGDGALAATLASLAALHGPGREVLLVTPGGAGTLAETLAATCPGARVVTATGRDPGGWLNQGAAAARGTYVVFLQPGDLLHPAALLDGCETVFRHGAQTGISQFRRGTGAAAIPHNGFDDMCPLPAGTPPTGPLTLSPQAVLGLAPELSARIFARDFLAALPPGLAPGFTAGARPHWALCLAAPLLAETCVYIAWGGVMVEDAPDGARARALPTTARGLARGHDAMVRTLVGALNGSQIAPLPDGWQRRLFARALRDQVDRCDTGRGFLAGCMLAAARRHLTGPGRAPAGFDPAFGPRLARLLNPAGMIPGRAPLLPHGPAPEPAESAARTHAFALSGRGRFRYRADFHEDDYANLTFLAGDRLRVPFHLSLRFPEQQAVVNDTRADGSWRAERRVAIPLPRDGVEVSVDIAPPRVTVEIDGRRVFRLGRRWLRRAGLAGLGGITLLRLEGAIRPLDMMPAAPGPQLVLDPRLQLRAAQPAADSVLRLGHSGEVLPVTPAAIPAAAPGDSAGLVADLPGRYWQGLSPGAPLVITDAEGAALLSLTRADMAARIEQLMTAPPGAADSALVLQMLDHLRHGDLHPHLSAAALAGLRRLAEGYGLAAYVAAADATALRAAPAAPETGSDVDAALARFHRSQQSPCPPEPLAVVRELTLPMPARREMYLALTEIFCRKGGDFDGLFALAAETVLADLPNGAADPWTQSALLPYLLRAGRTNEAGQVLTALADPGKGWMLTPPLAWAMRHAQSAPDLSPAQRAALLSGAMAAVEALAQDYWGRAHCRELTAAAADLVLRTPGDNGRQPGTAAFCLRVYGLSRLFWEMIGTARTLPPSIAAARQAFRRLAAGGATPQEIDQALVLFDSAGCGDAARLRCDLLGPAGVPRPATAGPQAALRHLAFPAATAPDTAPDTALAASAATAVIALYPEVPEAPLGAVARAARGAVRALLDDPGDTAGLAALADSLAPLADARARFLGLGLAMTLVPALEAPAATGLADWIRARHDRLSEADRAAAARAPAVRGALARLGTAPVARQLAKTLAPNLASDLTTAAEAPAPSPPVSAGQDRSGLPAGSALFDTLVVVFSCEAYLGTRIPALRSGWLSLLAALDIPYVIVVGNGDGRRDGDILHLDAPDDYEGLPQKTLAAIRWVHGQTDFAHMLKIDDDCFLNAPLFFESLSYRRFDYYGRKLIRGVGNTDRAWHQEKSASARGREELDRSPEPSFYADGGSGYALSRRAMAAALASAARPAGQRLIQQSFMEDKLLGDLLALAGIFVENADYRVSIRRRSHRGAIPVAAWLNSFFPSRAAPLHLIHLDSHADQPAALERLGSPGLWPKKIWPSCQQVKLGYQSNALDLLSAAETVDRARAAEVAVVAVMRNEMFMAPHFLAHYRRLGVTSFLIADNGSDDGTREYLAEQPDVALFSVDTDYRLSHYGVAWQQALMAAFRVGKWSLVADADELLVWQEKPSQTLPDLLSSPAFDSAEAARIFMLDMYPEGRLEEATFASGDPFGEAGFTDAVPFLANTPARGPYSDAPVWTSALRHRLIPGSRATLFVAQKLALLRYHPFMRLSDGLHFVGDVKLAPRELLFGHFKYNAAFRDKARTEVARRQHFNDAEEYRKYLALASEGRSVIFDPEISVPWTTSAFVRARLDR